MKTRRSLIVGVVALAALAALALITQLTQAQGPGPGGNVQPQGAAGVTAVLSDAIPIQGRLTNAGGTPLNGSYNVTFSLYDVESGGTALCSYNNPAVAVTDGLFAANMTGCAAADIDGDQLYLGVTVGADPEMTPRQPIYAVPYARSLRPGGWVNGSSNSFTEPVFGVGSSGGSGTAFLAQTFSGSGYAGYFANWGGGTAIQANGDVKQGQSYDGLVKGAVYAICSDSGSEITRSFNNVDSTAVTIANGTENGTCTIDFGFQINNRFFVTTAFGSDPPVARGLTCKYVDMDDEKLDCFRFGSTTGNGMNGSIMVLIY